MPMQQHRVLRQVLEIQVPEQNDAAEVHRQLGRLQHQYLQSVIETCCSEVSSPERLHRIEKLELDLGTVSLAQMESDLPRSLQTAMRQALRKVTEDLDRKTSAGEGHPATRSQLELVAFFARTGTLPWWADSRPPRQIPESIDFLLTHSPDDLATLLRDLLRYSESVPRLVVHCDDDLLLRVLDALAPTTSPGSISHQVKWVVGDAQRTPSMALSQARSALWIAALTHASWANVSPSAFWMRVFGSIAMRSHPDFAAISANVYEHVRSADPTVSPQIEPVAAALLEVGKRHSPLPNGTFIKLADWLRTRLSAGEPPNHLPRPDREGTQATQDLRRDSHQQQPTGNQAASGRSHLDENQTQPEVLPSPNLTERDSIRSARSLDLRFADADSVYIENSGLVILWPFLERFFERLQLLREKKFVDTAARHRAAGLLQCVATEDLSPPEYQMVLNKMLCGIDLDDLLDFGPPVTEEEAHECASLVTAAIENAPVLRKMSHEGFRGSFLLRKGALSANDGSWRLRVERETFDIVFDRFPWSFSWIKLAWMDAPLAVEW